jgi:hypothetical protein
MTSIPDVSPPVEADGFVPSPTDEAWAAETFAQSDRERTVEQLEAAVAAVRRWTSQPVVMHGPADLLRSVARYLATLGLEPSIQGDGVLFEFLGHVCELAFEDIDARLSRGPSDDELAAGASGLAVG